MLLKLGRCGLHRRFVRGLLRPVIAAQRRMGGLAALYPFSIWNGVHLLPVNYVLALDDVLYAWDEGVRVVSAEDGESLRYGYLEEHRVFVIVVSLVRIHDAESGFPHVPHTGLPSPQVS